MGVTNPRKPYSVEVVTPEIRWVKRPSTATPYEDETVLQVLVQQVVVDRNGNRATLEKKVWMDVPVVKLDLKGDVVG